MVVCRAANVARVREGSARSNTSTGASEWRALAGAKALGKMIVTIPSES